MKSSSPDTPNSNSTRLDKIYTRSGDSGMTSLALGARVSKTDDRIAALGEVDELNCQIGVVIAHLPQSHSITGELKLIQNTLFDIGGELAMNTPDYPKLAQAKIDNLEQALDKLNSQIPPLKEFVLPGGTIAAAHCHLARAVCRRVERQIIALSSTDSEQHPTLTKYINRLSDFLFVAARSLALENNGKEVLWQPSTHA